MANQNFKVKHGLEVGTGTTVSVDGINVSGVITPTTFAGDGSALTGVTAAGSGVVVQEEGSNIGTAATINFIGSNVTAALSGGIANVTVSAGGLSDVVSDTTPQLGGNLDLNSKDITGTGNISITGGFNVTGVSTFQENVVFQSTASFGDNDKINVGAGNDLQIYHDSNHSYIKNDTGTLIINTDEFFFKTNDNQKGRFRVDNTKVRFYIDGDEKLRITDDGLQVFDGGTITASSGIVTYIGDGSQLSNLPASDVVADTTPQLGGNLDANSKDIVGIASLSVAGVSTFVGNVNLLSDSGKFIAGAGGDLEIFHDGNDSGIRNNTGGLYLQNDGTIFIGDVGANEYSAKFHDDGATELYYDGTKRFETTDTGVNITDNLNVAGVSTFVGNVNLQANLDLQDNDKILIGTGDDLEISHDGTNSFVTHTGPGQLFITNETSGQDVVLRADNGGSLATYLQLDSSAGEVKINHAGSLKLATKSTGIDVTGNTETDDLTVTGTAYLNGTVSAASSTGAAGQVLQSTGVGVTWATTPATRTSQIFTAAEDQTTFSFNYTVGLLDVFYNGVKLASSEFTANNGTSIVLGDVAYAGDIIEFISYNTITSGSGGGGASILNGLSDVSIVGSPVIGETLTHNGTAFVNDFTTSQTTTATTQFALLSLDLSVYRSVEYQIQVTEGSKYHTTKILAIHNGTAAVSNEYGTLNIGASTATFDVDINGSNLRLLATPASSNSTVFKVKFTGIKV